MCGNISRRMEENSDKNRSRFGSQISGFEPPDVAIRRCAGFGLGAWVPVKAVLLARGGELRQQRLHLNAGFGLRDSGFGIRDEGFQFQDSGFGMRV